MQRRAIRIVTDDEFKVRKTMTKGTSLRRRALTVRNDEPRCRAPLGGAAGVARFALDHLDRRSACGLCGNPYRAGDEARVERRMTRNRTTGNPSSL